MLDEAIDAVDGATHLVMSKRMRNLLSAASRQTSVAGFITWDKSSSAIASPTTTTCPSW
jgi:hypothetical protein